jgi:hypothetical protein
MAGFAMDLGDEGTAYEKGVNAPSASASAAAAQGMANLTKGLFGAMDAYSKAQTRGKPTEASLNKAGFANFVTQLDKLKGVTDPTRLKAGINSAISSYESLGFQLGDGEADAVFRRTGVDISSLTFNPAMAAAEAANKQLIENPAYMFLAEQKLSQSGKPFTSQDVATIALNDMKASEAAALYITSASNISKMEFQESYMPHANKVLQNIRAIALVGLQAEIAGGDVSPESMVQLRTSFDIAKSQLTRPLNITAEEFSPVKSQIDTLDALLGRLETYDKDMLTAETMAAMEPISAALLKQAKVLGKTDPILAQALLSDKVDWSSYVAGKWPEILKTLEKTETKDTVYTNLNVFDLPEAEVAAAVILHNNEEVEIATDRSDEDRLNAINNAFDFKVKLTQPINLNQPEHRDSFLNGVGQATVNVSTSNKLLSKETMDVLFDNDVFDKLNIVKKLDPEGHTLAVNQLKDALQSQSNIFATTMKGIVESTVFELTGIGEVKLKAEKTTSPSEWAGGLFQAKADKYYGGNIYRMIKDSGRALSTGERTELRGKGWGVEALGRNYSEITRANNQFKTYANYWRRLGGDPSTMESMILTRQEDDAAPVDTNNNLTADQNADVTAAINEDFIGIPLEDIDFESNAEATPKEPDEEIVTTTLDSANVDFSFIKEREGYEKSMDVPTDDNGSVLGKSGPTIASGFDLGQRSEADLVGLPVELVNKLKPYLGLTGDAAKLFVDNNKLTLTTKELDTINEFAKKQEIGKLKQAWNNSTSTVSFDDLTKEQATVVASVAFQYGNLATETPKFWGYVTSGDWVAAAKELRNFGDKYPSRRKLEANYLEGK